jgi:hypothetical protein
MSSLLEKLKSQAKKADLGYGIHEPVVILTVDNEPRKTKDGEKIKRNNFTVFGKLNKDGNVIAQKEISWFNVDPTSEFAYSNLFNQVDQMVGILDCYYDQTEEDIVAEAFDAIFEEEEITSQEDLENAIKDKESCKRLMNSITEAYLTLLQDKIGIDSTKLRLKLTFDAKGKYLQNPKYDPFTESMSIPKEDSKLKLTKTEEENRQKSLVTSSPALGAPVNI